MTVRKMYSTTTVLKEEFVNLDAVKGMISSYEEN